jgi:plasmid maintenance system antidote protein VapI
MHPLEKYLKTNKIRYTAFAKMAGCHVGAIWNVAKGKRQVGHALARKINRVSGIPLSKLRPDIWGGL